MGQRHQENTSGAANRLWQDHCICESNRRLCTQRWSGVDSGSQGRASGPGSRQVKKDYKVKQRGRKSRGFLSWKLVSGCSRVCTDTYEREAVKAVSRGLFRHHHHRRGASLHLRQLSKSLTALPGRSCFRRNSYARPRRYAKSRTVFWIPGLWIHPPKSNQRRIFNTDQGAYHPTYNWYEQRFCAGWRF